VYLYPNLDSVVWTIDEAPALERVLAFDGSAGTVAYVDSKGFPGRIDLRETDVGKASKAKLTSLSSANGSDIYGINPKGEIVRLNPNGGDWHFKPPVPARSVIAEPTGELIVSANKGAQTLVWKVRPPDDVIQDSTVLPLSGRAVSTQMGDRVYFTVDSGLVGVKVKDLSPLGAIELASRVRALAPTPSGDRIYVATAADSSLSIIDRYSGRVETGVTLAAPPEDLRMDPLGRYLLARFPKADSAWIIAIGTNRLLGAFPTRWSVDLPAITPGGEVATLGDKDVVLLDPEKLTAKSTVAGGAKDFWYFFAWDGFRPRARGLDPDLANQVATQLTAKDALGAHARDELGISDTLSARPVQAALASAGTFALGAAMPLLLVLFVPVTALVWTVSSSSLFFLALLGSLAARAGGSPIWKSVARVTFWGALAMALTAGVGALFGTAL